MSHYMFGDGKPFTRPLDDRGHTVDEGYGYYLLSYLPTILLYYVYEQMVQTLRLSYVKSEYRV